MLAIQLGDTRGDIVSTLSLLMGQAGAEKLFADFEKLIADKAKTGALAATPGIESAVRTAAAAAAGPAAKAAVMPYVIGAMALGGLGLLAGLGAFIRARRR